MASHMASLRILHSMYTRQLVINLWGPFVTAVMPAVLARASSQQGEPIAHLPQEEESGGPGHQSGTLQDKPLF